jgi:hypothetical protein
MTPGEMEARVVHLQMKYAATITELAEIHQWAGSLLATYQQNEALLASILEQVTSTRDGDEWNTEEV